MIMEEKRFIDDLSWASIFDIVKTEEISKFIEDGVFTSEYDIYMEYENVISFLPHHCNGAWLVNNPDGKFRCQKLDNVRVSNDKKSTNLWPNDYSIACLKILQWIGLTKNLHIDADENVL